MAFPHSSESELTDTRAFVYEKALSQGGVFRRTDLASWNIDPQLPRMFVRRHWWVRLKHGVYCDAEIFNVAKVNHSVRHQLHTALAVAGFTVPTHAFGVSAAMLHNLSVPDHVQAWPAEVNRPPLAETRDRSKSLPGLPQGMRVTAYTIRATNLVEMNGVPSASRSLAAVSLASELNDFWALSVLDSAAWQRPDLLIEFQEILECWSNLRGAGMLKKIIPLSRPGAQTPLESISRIQLLWQHLPEPELQHPFHDRKGLIGYADMYWPALKVIGEADGMLKYQNREDLLQEKLREDRLRALGLEVVRWTWDEIWNHPREIALRIRQASALNRRAAS